MNTLRYVVLVVFLILKVSIAFKDNRIVGGRPAEDGEFPYQVSLRRAYNDAHFCGGSVVAPRWILTAAHCMFYSWGGMITPFSMKVVVGQNNLRLTETSIVRIPKKIILHPSFDDDSLSNDVALLELEEALPMDNPFVSMAAISDEPIRVGSSCIVSGWGVQQYGSQKVSDILLAASVDVIDLEVCKMNYERGNITLPDGVLCAATINQTEEIKDACQGDSGGPLFSRGRQVGIVSTGNGCADPQYPGIYTDVSIYYQWINNYITKNPYKRTNYSY